MKNSGKYNTKQRSILLDYLQSKAGRHITAGDVCEHFKSQGTSIGQSTIYRQLESLVDEGVLNKYSIDAGSPACFEYIPEGACNEEGTCFHCKCEKCGKLIHLHCHEMEDMMGHIMADHRFKVDPIRTVLYGICEDCR